jgi:hypothetical protein
MISTISGALGVSGPASWKYISRRCFLEIKFQEPFHGNIFLGNKIPGAASWKYISRK